jgi:hypothetical protein
MMTISHTILLAVLAFSAGLIAGNSITLWKTRKTLAPALRPLKGLVFGEPLEGGCPGCGQLVCILIGHPLFKTTCTNVNCVGNHVAQGNRYGVRPAIRSV